jgi:hypothetical protein
MFTWFDALGAKSLVMALRAYARPYSSAFPHWVYFSLPQALWFFSGIVAFNCIWGTTSTLLYDRLWILAFVGIAFGFEVGQFLGLVPGHFDILDVVLLVIAFLGALLVNHLINHHERGYADER